MTRPPIEVADVIRQHGDAFLGEFGATLTPEQRRVLHDLTRCRTAELGGHVEECDCCGHRQIAYNSCRNRHCPKCQANEAARWVEARASELLPVEYFHVVFTLPAILNPIALHNHRVVYNHLFRAAAATLLQVAADPKRLGAEIGLLAVLHTWGRTLQYHPHVHCAVPGGGLSLRRNPVGRMPTRVLSASAGAQSRVFRGSLLQGLQKALARKRLTLPGKHREHGNPGSVRQLLRQAARTEWVVYAKPPFGGPELVLKYLARYTHRVAISNHRLVKLENGQVCFRYKGLRLTRAEARRRRWRHRSSCGGSCNTSYRRTSCGFVRYGCLANCRRQERLELCRKLFLKEAPKYDQAQAPDEPRREVMPASSSVIVPALP